MLYHTMASLTSLDVILAVKDKTSPPAQPIACTSRIDSFAPTKGSLQGNLRLLLVSLGSPFCFYLYLVFLSCYIHCVTTKTYTCVLRLLI